MHRAFIAFALAALAAAAASAQITALEFPGTSDANRSFRRTVQGCQLCLW